MRIDFEVSKLKMLSKRSRILIAGHKGMVGSAVVRKLEEKKILKTCYLLKKQLNYLDQKETMKFLKKKKADYVIICAVLVGNRF